MAYTPQLSLEYSRTLRRIAWALKMPMTRAMEKVFDQVVSVTDPKMVCEACRDKSLCSECVFKNK